MANFDLVVHLERQREWSVATFGPGDRTVGIVAHLREELQEVLDSDGRDLSEWVDVVILALDGAWRVGFSSEEVAAAIEAKQTKNEGREWPDWRQFTQGEAINHDRSKGLMPGTNAGTGHPYTFACWRCRKLHGGVSSMPRSITWEATGRVRERWTGNGSGRVSGSHQAEYRCSCGHSGWSRHRSVLRAAGHPQGER